MNHEHTAPQACMCDQKDGVCNCNHHDTTSAAPAQHSHTHTHAPKTLGDRVKPYTRLILTLSVVIVFGIVLSFVTGFSWLTLMDYWMGGYFLAFGIMQVLSLKKSAAMLRGYDPLAKIFTPYSFAYPLIQIGLGIGYFFMVWPIAISGIASVILLINTIGVDSVIRKKEVVRCGCLGEAMNVPVSRITLTENLVMLGMAIFMLALHVLMYLIAFTTGGDVEMMPGMKM